MLMSRFAAIRTFVYPKCYRGIMHYVAGRQMADYSRKADDNAIAAMAFGIHVSKTAAVYIIPTISDKVCQRTRSSGMLIFSRDLSDCNEHPSHVASLRNSQGELSVFTQNRSL